MSIRRVIRNGKRYQATPVEVKLPNGETKIVVKMMEVIITDEMKERRNKRIAEEKAKKNKPKKKGSNFISLF
tara:strand:- start:4953 stop:5168 length:216 start_codon:yes stop_codon:yes gene_type:complete